MNLAFIGPKHLVTLLKTLGLAVFTCETEREARKALEEVVAKKEFNLIYITERLAVDLMERINELNQDPSLNIVLISDNRGSIGLARKEMGNLIQKSIGASILIRK